MQCRGNDSLDYSNCPEPDSCLDRGMNNKLHDISSQREHSLGLMIWEQRVILELLYDPDAAMYVSHSLTFHLAITLDFSLDFCRKQSNFKTMMQLSYPQEGMRWKRGKNMPDKSRSSQEVIDRSWECSTLSEPLRCIVGKYVTRWHHIWDLKEFLVYKESNFGSRFTHCQV